MASIIREKGEKSKFQANRRRKKSKATRSRQYSKKIKEIIKKAAKEPLSTRDIISCLKNVPNFVGVFSSDQLKFVKLHTFPIFFVVNLDVSSGPGLHWLSVRISRRHIEIFDSLGLNPSLWSVYPKHLFQFLSSYRFSHKFTISPILQPVNTFTCGAFVIFFILYRQNHTYSQCLRVFSKSLSKNYLIIKHLL